MTISDERSRCRADPLRGAVVDFDAECFAMLTLENAEGCASVEFGLNTSLFLDVAEDGVKRDAFESGIVL